MEDDDPRHGTVNGYANLGCRCQPCRVAGLTYQRKYRLKRNQSGPPEHGTYTAYTNWGCRCDECKAARSAWKKAYDQKKK